MKRISIFGSTGAIGTKTIDLLKLHKDDWVCHALIANQNIDLLSKQALELNPEYVITADRNLYNNLKNNLAGTSIKIEAGEDKVESIAKDQCDIMLMAITGIAALKPVIAAIKAKSNIALANKESLVCSGEIMMDLAQQYNVNILPIDSEHNAIFQILQNSSIIDVKKIYLTASGGPFRNMDINQLESVDLESALSHPNWVMGKKITIDSATMMNKALEIIEAHHLFNLPEKQIETIIHPESIIHGMVSFIDGAIIAELGTHDMTTAISYAINWPNRKYNNVSDVDFVKLKNLSFQEISKNRWHAPFIARDILNSENKSSMSIIFNAANEIAVENFLNKKIRFIDIINIIENSLDRYSTKNPSTIDDVYIIDNEARIIANQIINDI